MVDSIAKDTAHEIYAGILFAPNFITFADAVKVSVDIAQKSWQFKWNNDVTGNYTRQLIPKVGVKIHLPEDRNVGISYCRLLLHNTMLKKDAHRTGLSDTPVCDCGNDRKSAEHYLLNCTKYLSLIHI